MFYNNKLLRSSVILINLLALLVLLTACNVQLQSSGSYVQVPAGMAYSEGKEIYFIHTEVSDAGIAEKLTNMMKSPVLHVPSLAQVSETSLAVVYVFENGLVGKGPLGFQVDVFNSSPGSAGYTPLRQIILVKWVESGKATELKSEAEILNAKANGILTTTKSGVVVNMPFVVWEGGKR